ncbi:hypothetical protein GON26_01380 [Flavobacterium sp. GA093]|uniref:Uncharacterized protein n=1 Tax=Flavobacterium hydrocarbonoxydans TaxID=2683249 RepID=A0A6I4NFV6_9FLAO|nr:hypothetical protein [Flavobacterium hydrocarbonoxydans]MWB93001.1 hypothetical protein [Flavobacterium hydrocarbonoxydans]
MIRSTVPLLYDARNGEKSAIVEIEIPSWQTGQDGITYNVRDYAINNDVKEFISSKFVFYSWDQINSLNDYIESIYVYSGLTKKETEYLKVKHALLLETKTRPIYGSNANLWVLI